MSMAVYFKRITAVLWLPNVTTVVIHNSELRFYKRRAK